MDGRLQWVSERSAASVWDDAERRWSCHFKWKMEIFIFLPGIGHRAHAWLGRPQDILDGAAGTETLLHSHTYST